MTFDAGAIEARLILDRRQFTADMAAARAEGKAFEDNPFKAKATLDYDQVKNAFKAIQRDWTTLKANLEKDVKVSLDDKELRTKIAAIEKDFALLRTGLMLEMNIDDFNDKMAEVNAAIDRLKVRLATGNELRVDNSKAILDIAEVSAAFNTMRRSLERTIKLTVDTGGSDIKDITAAAKAIDSTGTAADRSGPRIRGFAAAVLGLNSEFRLFGGFLPGFLGTIGGLHLWADALIEVAGTLIPAAIAFTAFGVAATPVVLDLSKQMFSLWQVTKAYGVALGPITGNFQKLSASIKPEVYVLFGEALIIAGHNTGSFAILVQGAAHALDELGARFTNSVVQGTGFQKFAEGATKDLQGWGTLIGNIGGIIGNVLNVLPGYAEQFLNLANSLTHVIETLTGSGLGQWLLEIGIAAHGALVWVGLLATGFTILAGRALTALPGLLLQVAIGLDAIGASGAAASIFNLAGSIEALGVSTAALGALSLLGAAFGYLIYQGLTAKTAIQDFFDELQKGAEKANVLALTRTLTTQLSVAQKDYAVATDRVATAQARYNDIAANYPGLLRQAGGALATAKQNQADYAAGLEQIKGEQQTVNEHIGQAAKIFGSTTNAWSALNAAGITSAQLLDTNARHWQEAIIEAQAYDAALKATTQSAGRYGAAQNALNFSTGDSVNALGALDAQMQKVTQAEDALFNVLIGGEATFANFEQLLGGTTSAAGKQLNGLAQAASVAGASFGGLNSQSLKLSSDFYGQVLPAAQKQIDALQMQAISTRDLTKVIATQASQLLKYTGNNVAARVAVADLINNALGPGTVSLQTLNRWTKNNTTSLAGYKTIVDKTQLSASTLAGILGNQLNVQFRNSLLAASGADKATQNFATSIVNTGTKSQQTKSARDVLIADLEKAGFSARDAKNYVDGLTRSIGGLHGKDVQIHMDGSGLYTITGKVISTSHGGGSGNAAGGLAAGGRITAGTTPTADDVLIRVSKDETVVSAAHSANPIMQSAFAAVGVPGFAGGGVVSGKLTPTFVTSMAQNFETQMTNAMIDAMRASTKAAEEAARAAAAKAAAQGGAPGGLGGPTSAGAAAAQAYARGRLGAYGWGAAQFPPLQSLWNGESGWNRLARNPGSGAYGIPQALPGSKMGAEANPPTSSAAAQINWGLGYIRSVYGTPANAFGTWSGRSPHWYDEGGPLQPGWTMAYNGTGQTEHVVTANAMSNLIESLQGISTHLEHLVGSNTGSGIASYSPGQFVGDFTGVVSPAGGGFGLTGANLGIAPQPPPSSTGAGGGDTGTGGTGTGTTTPPPKKAAPNKSQKAAISLVEGHLGAYIWHNHVGYMNQAQSLLHWLGVTKYDHQLSEIRQLDTLLNRYRKAGNKSAIAATSHLLTSFGVHDFSPDYGTKINPAKAALIKKLTALMKSDITNNAMTDAGQDNALLTHLGVSKFSGTLGEIRNLDSLLAKFKKAKNTGQVKAIETLLRQHGVHKYDMGGEWPNMTMGVNTSGRSEHVVSGSGMDELVSKLEQLVDVAQSQLTVARQAPGAIASRVGPAVANAPMTNAGLAKRYPNNR